MLDATLLIAGGITSLGLGMLFGKVFGIKGYVFCVSGGITLGLIIEKIVTLP